MLGLKREIIKERGAVGDMVGRERKKIWVRDTAAVHRYNIVM